MRVVACFLALRKKIVGTSQKYDLHSFLVENVSLIHFCALFYDFITWFLVLNSHLLGGGEMLNCFLQRIVTGPNIDGLFSTPPNHPSPLQHLFMHLYLYSAVFGKIYWSLQIAGFKVPEGSFCMGSAMQWFAHSALKALGMRGPRELVWSMTCTEAPCKAYNVHREKCSMNFNELFSNTSLMNITHEKIMSRITYWLGM